MEEKTATNEMDLEEEKKNIDEINLKKYILILNTVFHKLDIDKAIKLKDALIDQYFGHINIKDFEINSVIEFMKNVNKNNKSNKRKPNTSKNT